MDLEVRPVESVRILHLEDNILDSELFKATLLDSGIDVGVTRVDTREGFTTALEVGGFDLIVSDFTLPSFDGESALRIARERRPEIPFIFVSGTIGEETAVEAVLSGATDYLLKNNLSRLVPAIRRALKESTQRAEEKRLHEALLKSEAQYRQIVETTEDGVWKIDAEGKTTFINPKTRAIFGMSSEEMLGQPFMDFVAAEDREGVARRLAGRKREVFEVRFQKKDASDIWGLVATTPFIEDGRYVGGLMMVTDITEKKELEAQFLQTQKMEAIGQLAGGVAHDFNNLLQVILGYIQLLESTLSAGGSGKSELGQIQSAAEKASVLTRQLLAFGRRQVFEATRVDLNHVIGDMGKMMGRVIGEEYEINLDLEQGLATLQADPGQIEQVLMNLCVNARDAMPNGGRIDIVTQTRVIDPGFTERNPWAKEGTYATVSFSDNGIGMEPRVLERIYEPFFTTKPPGCGTGLGLSTVFGIVKQHNGFLNVVSEIGNGTTFEIFLPMDGASETAPPSESRTAEIPGGSETILVAEDDEGVRTLTATVLRTSGYRVYEAADGEEALRSFKRLQKGIDLAILDLVMPRLDGKTIRDTMMALCPRMKFLFTTGYSRDVFTEQTTKEAPTLGEEVLEKPFTPNDLLKRVRSILDKVT